MQSVLFGQNQLIMSKFIAGKPACPVGCKYCFITEHEQRRTVWNANPVAGINKACTFINVTPWIDTDPQEQARFTLFPWHLLEGDYVGFTAITDPFWPQIEKYLWEWMDRASEHAKLVTGVTKWPISRKVMKRLATYKNFYLVVGITGNWEIEKVPLKMHLRTLAWAKEYGVKTLPISHPYIAGMSDLSFLPEIKALGYDEFDVKGLRYCSQNMSSWMPEASKKWYEGREDEEILPEDGWRQLVSDAGLTLLSPRQWYVREGQSLSPKLNRKEAERQVLEVMKLANVVSSDSKKVFEASVRRRL